MRQASKYRATSFGSIVRTFGHQSWFTTLHFTNSGIRFWRSKPTNPGVLECAAFWRTARRVSDPTELLTERAKHNPVMQMLEGIRRERLHDDVRVAVYFMPTEPGRGDATSTVEDDATRVPRIRQEPDPLDDEAAQGAMVSAERSDEPVLLELEPSGLLNPQRWRDLLTDWGTVRELFAAVEAASSGNSMRLGHNYVVLTRQVGVSSQAFEWLWSADARKLGQLLLACFPPSGTVKDESRSIVRLGRGNDIVVSGVDAFNNDRFRVLTFLASTTAQHALDGRVLWMLVMDKQRTDIQLIQQGAGTNSVPLVDRINNLLAPQVFSGTLETLAAVLPELCQQVQTGRSVDDQVGDFLKQPQHYLTDLPEPLHELRAVCDTIDEFSIVPIELRRWFGANVTQGPKDVETPTN